MKTSKITECLFTNQSTTAYGTYFYHRLTFENGDIGSIGVKNQADPKIQVGNTLNYDIVDGKVKISTGAPAPPPPPPVTEKKPYSKGYAKSPQEFLGYVYSYSKDVVCAKIAAKQKVEDPAKEIMDLSETLYEHIKKMLNS